MRTRARATRSRSRPTSAGGEQLDQALATFAVAYADQNESDHRALLRAVRKKRLKAVKGM